MDWWDFIRKYQTSLPQFDPKLDRDTGYAGVPPVQQISAQPKEYTRDYLQGEYPDEFWSIVGNDPEDTKGHGGSRHRVDKDGNYVMVGVRGDSPVGDLPKRGPYRPRKGRKNYPQDFGVRVTQKKDMPSRKNIVVKPMNVKKEAKSPAAIEHKRKYETEYESTPARKKYRRELERERRKRGVAGKGGGDMSHTKTGKIVVEDPHTNRARSHPSVGSTLKMVIVKDYYFKEPESYDEDGNPMQTTKTGKTVPLARGIANPKMKPKYNLAHPKNVALGEEGADAFAEYLGSGVMHEETHRAMEPDIRAAMNELPDTMTDAEKRAWYMRAHEIGAYQGQFPGGQDAHEEAEATALGQRDSPRHPFIDESITRFPKPIVKMVIVKEQKKLFVEGQKTLDGQPAFAPTDFVAEQQRRANAQAEEEAKIARKRAMILQAKRAGMTTPLHEFQQNPE